MESALNQQKFTGWTGLLYACFALLSFVSCQPVTTENRLEQMAKGCCECTTHLLELNQQTAQPPENVDFKVLEAEYQRTKDCLGTVTTHFGKLKKEELAQLEKQLQTKCPNLAAQHDLLRELLGE